MYLSQLLLTNFKNHSSIDLAFNEKITVFIGQNGIGKTNILDAIYFLSVFRSHIHHIDSQLVKQGEDFFRLKGVFSEEYEVVAKFTGRTKTIEINQVKIKKYSESFGHIPLIISSPTDIFLLHDGSEERRKLIDYTISIYDKEYLAGLNEYQHFLDQRNGLLKLDVVDMDLIQIYNQRLALHGDQIFEKRKVMMESFSDLVIKWYQTIAGNEESIGINYSSQLLEDTLAQLLTNRIEKDKILKRTTAGIHRDDIKFDMLGMDFKKTASQGQQKSLLYAIRLAQAEWISKQLSKKLIFLLDDFSDKLDQNRQQLLLDLIQKIDFVDQWFITDTKKEPFENISDLELKEFN